MNAELDKISIIGAAGKMGRGIALLLLQEMAQSPAVSLTLLDANPQEFPGLRTYLKDHLTKLAERRINGLRKEYASRADLVDNAEIIGAFVSQAMDRVRFVTAIEECRGAKLIFEAIVEDVQIKADLFQKIKSVADPRAYYFTNTSSIPISVLEEKSLLKGRLIGFHFYNPPPVQKLLEIIVPKSIEVELKNLASAIAKRLNKTVVYADDVAGFIGNGHFIREIVFACNKALELEKSMSSLEAIGCVDYISQEFLLRPMGIFQLIDYVGIDVCLHIATIMSTYLPGNTFVHPLVETMVSEGIRGGQKADGSQKEGFFQYSKGKPIAIYDLKARRYQPIDERQYITRLGPLPEGHHSWKILSKDNQKKEKISHYFQQLWQTTSLGAELSQEFLKNSQAIAHRLVDEKVAHSISDVDTVLREGFFHLYGVDTPFLAVESTGRLI